MVSEKDFRHRLGELHASLTILSTNATVPHSYSNTNNDVAVSVGYLNACIYISMTISSLLNILVEKRTLLILGK